MENQHINNLHALWKKEHDIRCTTQIRNFSEFARRYNNDIFTRNIAKGLYYKILSDNFDKWLEKFRRKDKFKFVSKSEIEYILKEIKIALEKYLKHPTSGRKF